MLTNLLVYSCNTRTVLTDIINQMTDFPCKDYFFYKCGKFVSQLFPLALNNFNSSCRQVGETSYLAFSNSEISEETFLKMIKAFYNFIKNSKGDNELILSLSKCGIIVDRVEEILSSCPSFEIDQLVGAVSSSFRTKITTTDFHNNSTCILLGENLLNSNVALASTGYAPLLAVIIGCIAIGGYKCYHKYITPNLAQEERIKIDVTSQQNFESILPGTEDQNQPFFSLIGRPLEVILEE